MLNFLKKFIALFNTLEGVIHLITAGISFWGIFRDHVWSWEVWAAPVENLVLGVFSLFTGYVLGIKHHHHHVDSDHDKEVETEIVSEDLKNLIGKKIVSAEYIDCNSAIRLVFDDSSTVVRMKMDEAGDVDLLVEKEQK